jgi:hypothetical protein
VQTFYEQIELDKKLFDLEFVEKRQTTAVRYRNGILAAIAFLTTLLISLAAANLIPTSVKSSMLSLVVILLLVGIALYIYSVIMSARAHLYLNAASWSFLFPLSELNFIKQEIGRVSLGDLEAVSSDYLKALGVYSELVGRDRFYTIDFYEIILKARSLLYLRNTFKLGKKGQYIYLNLGKELFVEYKELLLNDKSLVEYDKKIAHITGRKKALLNLYDEYEPPQDISLS